jgi:hypothetical protein
MKPTAASTDLERKILASVLRPASRRLLVGVNKRIEPAPYVLGRHVSRSGAAQVPKR